MSNQDLIDTFVEKAELGGPRLGFDNFNDFGVGVQAIDEDWSIVVLFSAN